MLMAWMLSVRSLINSLWFINLSRANLFKKLLDLVLLYKCIIMKKSLFILFCFIGLNMFAQHTTTGDDIEKTSATAPKVLLIPFESRMYISDIDKNLAAKNEMNYKQIREKFRSALDQNIYIKLKKEFSPISFYTFNPEEASKELSYIYNSIGYKYEIMPVDDDSDKKNNLFSKFKKGKKEKKEGIVEGEIVSEIDNTEKYMKTNISNKNLITTLNKSYQTSFYIFINELDIRKSAENVYESSNDNFKREVKVHYTILDKSSKIISSGAIKSSFDSGQNDIEKIIKSTFPEVATKILEKLLPDQENKQ